MKIQFELKSAYGRILAYPACDTSRLLAELIEQKTFTRREIKLLKALGYLIETVSGSNLEQVA